MSNATATTAETIEISLTDRFPIRVAVAEWPTRAHARTWDNTYEFQANRTSTLKVRGHDDGRWIVYGFYLTNFSGERDRRGGEIVDERDDVAAAIHRVAEHLGLPDYLVDECIADLPAEVLSGDRLQGLGEIVQRGDDVGATTRIAALDDAGLLD